MKCISEQESRLAQLQRGAQFESKLVHKKFWLKFL